MFALRLEHRIGVIKRVLGFTKARYRGLAKNTQRMWVVAVSPICSSPGINCDAREGQPCPASLPPVLEPDEFSPSSLLARSSLAS